MKECIECGERAKYQHPEFTGDSVCGECLISLLDDAAERSIDDLKDAVKETGIKSYFLDSIEEEDDG